MVTLPDHALRRRAWLMSFGAVLGIAFGLDLCLVTWFLGLDHGIWYGAALATAVTTASTLRPRLVTLPMRLWNRAARTISHLGTHWISAVCFFVILTAGGRRSSILPLVKSPEFPSQWVPVARTLADSRGRPEVPWIRDFLHWTRTEGGTRMLALLPFIWLLWALRIEDSSRLPGGSNYTLY